MRKHITRLLTTLLALVMLLPIVAQAAPTDGWTDEAEQAYQTVTQLVIQRVTESKDYLATATQEENAKAVYALWTSGATVPGGFYDEYLQALADWLDLAVKRGKTAYIPGAIRTVAAMGLDVTDFAGHDLMDALRKPELVEADEDRLDMLMDLDAAGDAGKTDEFNALREQLLTEALARQQSSGEFRYTSKWPAEPDAPDDRGKAVERRTYINEAGLIGLCSVRPAVAVAGTPSASTPEKGNRQDNAIDYSELLQAQSADYAQKLAEGYYGDGNSTIVSEGALSHLAKEILSMSEAGGGKLPEEQRAQLESLVEMLSGASGEYLMGRKANTYSPVLVQAMKALDMDPADVNGMDFLAPLTNLSAMDTAEYREALMDFDSVDASMWRKRGVDADTVVDKYAAGILQYQTADGQFDPYASYSGIVTPILRDYVQYTAENVTALAPHADKEYISKAIDRAIEYLSSVQLSDGSFPGMTGTSNGEATLAVLEMMEALGISLDDPRFVKNGKTAADAMKTFYVDGVGFLSSFEVEAPLDDLGSLPVYADPVMDASAAVSALTYLQAAEDGTFGPDGKGSSVFEVVGAALTETPLGAILLAVIVVAILAFAMVRRYRRIKREQ